MDREAPRTALKNTEVFGLGRGSEIDGLESWLLGSREKGTHSIACLGEGKKVHPGTERMVDGGVLRWNERQAFIGKDKERKTKE